MSSGLLNYGLLDQQISLSESLLDYKIYSFWSTFNPCITVEKVSGSKKHSCKNYGSQAGRGPTREPRVFGPGLTT
jgi:hypothetical protein